MSNVPVNPPLNPPYATHGAFGLVSDAKQGASTRSIPIPAIPGPLENEIPISQLPLAGPIMGDEMLVCVQNGIDVRLTSEQIAALKPPTIYLNKVLTLYYVATQAQTLFQLQTPDKFGHVIGEQAVSDIEVYAGGNRLALDDGSGYGGYTVDYAGDTVTLLWPAGPGEVVIFDLFQAPPIPRSLYYLAAQGQTVFPLSVLDRFGNKATTGQAAVVAVFAGGSRLAPNDLTGQYGSYSVNSELNTVTLNWPTGAGEQIVFDLFEAAAVFGLAHS